MLEQSSWRPYFCVAAMHNVQWHLSCCMGVAVKFHSCVLLMGHSIQMGIYMKAKKALPYRAAILLHCACVLFLFSGLVYTVFSLWKGDKMGGRNMRSSVVLLTRCLVIVSWAVEALSRTLLFFFLWNGGQWWRNIMWRTRFSDLSETWA